MAEYDWYVHSYPIKPPVGQNGWGANARIKRTGTGRNDDFIELGERLGVTEGHARAKAEADAAAWLAERTPEK